MTDANTRGEVTVMLDGAEHVMRPSYEAIEAIEEKTNTGITALLHSLADGTMKKRTLAIIVTELVRAWGRAAGKNPDPIQRDAAGANPSRVGELIYEAGQTAIMNRCAIVLLGALNGGVTASGEWKPVATETHAAG